MPVEVRRIHAGEGMLLRQMRLAALADAPQAFASTLEQESLRSRERWEADAATWSEGFDSVTFFAEDAGCALGLVGAFRSVELSATVELVSLWVAPPVRGRRLGERLIGAVVAWAAAGGARTVALRVASGNAPARALYSRTGFLPSSESAAGAGDPGSSVEWMTRDLIAPSPG